MFRICRYLRSNVRLRSTDSNAALRTTHPAFSNLSFTVDKPSPYSSETKILNSDGINNLKMVARPTRHGPYCTLGLMVETGSSDCHQFTSGLAHINEKLAFGRTADSFDSEKDVTDFLNERHGICECMTDRECTIYALSISKDDLEDGLKLLLETAFRPIINEETLTQALNKIQTELQYMKYEEEREKEMLELLCQASYRGNSHGLIRMMPEDLLHEIEKNPEDKNKLIGEMFLYRQKYYNPNDVSITAVGVSSEELESVVRKLLPIIQKPSWKTFIPKDVDELSYVSQWTGGITHKSEQAQVGFTQYKDNVSQNYVAIGWEAPSYSSQDRYTAHVLRAMLGGGRSFSSGGPGKGITSKLYTEILGSGTPGLDQSKAQYKEFTDSGIFYINARVDYTSIKVLLDLQFALMKKLRDGTFSSADVEKAKTQLIGETLRAYEDRNTVMESYARETQAYNAPLEMHYVLERVQNVTKKDIITFVDKLLKSKPSVALLGEMNGEYGKKELDKFYNDICMAQFNDQKLHSSLQRMYNKIMNEFK